ncbi:MAG: NAD(P)H-binding protein, partial [Thermodesulfobacteriota bacterium]
MKILIIGATRGIGKYLTEQSLAKGHIVIAAARKKGFENFKHDNLSVIQVNILDKKSIEYYFENIDTVCITIGTRPTFKSVNVFSEGTKNVVELMKNKDCRHLLCATGIG